MPTTQNWASIYHSSLNKVGLFENLLILEQGQENKKTSWRHWGSAEINNKKDVKATHKPSGKTPKGQDWNTLSNKINMVELDFNVKYKINIYKSKLV
jgi:hypothetical protein